MKKTTNRKRKAGITLLLQIVILFCYIRLFSFCYSFAYHTSMESGMEGVIQAIFGGLA